MKFKPVFKSDDDIREEEREKIFDSKKGDKVMLLKKDGTEQIWKCIKIKIN